MSTAEKQRVTISEALFSGERRRLPKAFIEEFSAFGPAISVVSVEVQEGSEKNRRVFALVEGLGGTRNMFGAFFLNLSIARACNNSEEKATLLGVEGCSEKDFEQLLSDAGLSQSDVIPLWEKLEDEEVEKRKRFWEGLYPDEDERRRVQEYVERVSALDRVQKVVLLRFNTGGERIFLLFDNDWDGILSEKESDVAADGFSDLLVTTEKVIWAVFPRTEQGFEDHIKASPGDLGTQQITLWTRQEVDNVAAA